jgi:hypothetical protein
MAVSYTDWEGILEEDEIGVVSIRPLEDDPRFLGCDDPKYELPEDHPLRNMVYASMKRPAKLPKLHSEDRDFKCRLSKEYFMKLWSGDVEVHWKEVWDRPPNINGLYLCVAADDLAHDLMSTLDPGPSPPLHHDRYVLAIRLCPIGPVRPDSDVGCSPVSNLSYDHSPLRSFYHLSQLESLMFRIMHRFYRVFAYRLSHFHLDQVHSQLKMFFVRENQWFTESLDVLMIWADVLIFVGTGIYEQQMYPVLCIGKTLQAKGRFNEAAALYEDVVNHWDHLNNQGSKRHPTNAIDSTAVMKNAGTAHRHADDLVEAERCLVRAIWIDCNRQERRGERTSVWEWDATTFETVNYLVDVYVLWHIVHHVHAKGLLTYEEMPKVGHLDARLFPILAGLLDTAAQGTPAKMDLRNTYSVNALAAVQQIKNRFVASPGAARTAIHKAATSQTPISVEQFRENLYSYHNARRRPFVLKVSNSSACLDQLNVKSSSETGHCMRLVREQVHRSSLETPAGVMQMAECSNCKQIFPRHVIMRCPCKEVEYCGQECQLAGWHAGHKMTCAAKKKNQARGNARA